MKDVYYYKVMLANRMCRQLGIIKHSQRGAGIIITTTASKHTHTHKRFDDCKGDPQQPHNFIL